MLISMTLLSLDEIKAELAARLTPDGKILMAGLTSKQLATWGVPWPPPKGWLKRLKSELGLRPQRSVPEVATEISTEPPPSTKLIGAKTIVIHTDGACFNNPGPGGWAAVLTYGDKRRELVGSEPATTNNRMELMAAIAALEGLKQPCHVLLYTDSQYVINGITKWINSWKRHDWKRKGWKAKGEDNSCVVINSDLWQRLDAARQPHEVEWTWVKGHAGTVENERCDFLAEAAAKRAMQEI